MLTRTELQTLFPEAEIWTERFLGMNKSFIAVRIEPENREKWRVV